MKKFLSIVAIVAIVLSSSFGPLHSLRVAHAQISDNADQSIPAQIPDVTEEVDVTVTPENPQPNQAVTITLDAPGTDLNRATISWKRNGLVEKSGVGAKSFTFTAGALGSVSNVIIDVLPHNGRLVEKTVQVNAQSVDILWEASSYRPPFYKGKSFYTPEGRVTFMAMPNLVDSSGRTIDPRTLVYNWRIDDTAHADKSGYNKNYYMFDGDILGQQTLVEVHVTNVKGDVAGDGTLIIKPGATGVLAYENNPTYGILFNKAIADSFNLKKSEISLSAYPFNVSAASRNDSTLAYSWSINSNPVNTPTSQTDMVFRNSNNDLGTSQISLSLQNTDKILQAASYNFNILLNQKSNQVFSF